MAKPPRGRVRYEAASEARADTASILPSEKPTAVAQFPCQKGCKVEHYRGADWLRPRLQEPQKRWIPGKRPRVRIHLPPAGSHVRTSTGLRGRFPHYRYYDMVESGYRLITEGLEVAHLRLIVGSSMGG